MSEQQLVPGMAIGVQRPLYKHFGIYAGKFEGKELVIHYTDKIKEGSGEIEITSFGDFVKGDSYWIERFSGVLYTDDICSKSLERATSRLGERKYHAISNNCEYFVSWCVREQSQSGQVAKIASGIITNPRSVILEKAVEIGIVAVGKSF